MHHWAGIFDWDGVIIDSSRQHERSWQLLAKEEKHELPQHFFKRSFGMKNEKIIHDLLGWTTDPGEIQRLSLRKEAIYRELIRIDKVVPLAGVVNWLKTLKREEIPCAIASSTPRENIECVIDNLGLRSFFRVIVAAQDVTRGKPNPEVFLLAAQMLGIRPENCVVFEDAHVGIQAARAAGMKVVGVATTHPASALREADRVVGRMDELSIEEIGSWFSGVARGQTQ